MKLQMVADSRFVFDSLFKSENEDPIRAKRTCGGAGDCLQIAEIHKRIG